MPRNIAILVCAGIGIVVGLLPLFITVVLVAIPWLASADQRVVLWDVDPLYFKRVVIACWILCGTLGGFVGAIMGRSFFPSPPK
jgi:hypothetical protein